MEKVLNAWKCRKLTLVGRINIVKTLALSKLIFNASNLYVPPHFIDKVNNLIFNFIWEGKPPKIKKSTIVGEKVNGGLTMIDFGIVVPHSPEFFLPGLHFVSEKNKDKVLKHAQ